MQSHPSLAFFPQEPRGRKPVFDGYERFQIVDDCPHVIWLSESPDTGIGVPDSPVTMVR